METRETRLKRLRLRSWRRGMKEMDLILGGFADSEMSKLSDEQLDAHEMMMAENDNDLYVWVSGQQAVPEELKEAIALLQSNFLQNK